jgi:replicative DNA helicase
MIGGLQPTLTVIGSLPGVGKSALLATMAGNIARAGHSVALFSLEDDGDWAVWRWLARESAFNQFMLRNKSKSEAELRRISDGSVRVHDYGARVLVDDSVGLTADDVVHRARQAISRHGARVVIVDHLGELAYKRKERFDLEIDAAVGKLRDLSKTDDVAVVVACHLKRSDKANADAAPKLTDFAESASIERKARVALGLSRAPGGDRLRVDVLKQTNGSAGIYVELPFAKPYGLVEDDDCSKVLNAASGNEVHL